MASAIGYVRTSTEAQRPGLSRAVRLLGLGDVLLVARRDRLARSRAVAADLEAAVSALGARVASAVALADPEAADAFAEHESRLISERTRAALAAKKRRGERLGAPAFGWRCEDGEMIEVPEEQAIIGRVAELRADGLSLRDVVAELRREGVTARTGRPLGLTQVQRMAKRLRAERAAA